MRRIRADAREAGGLCPRPSLSSRRGNCRDGIVLLLRAGDQALLVRFSAPTFGVELRLPGQRSLRGRPVPPHDGVRSAGVGVSSTRFLRSKDHSRNDAPAIAVTSSWQELLSAQTRRNLSRSNYGAVTAASLVDQRNSVPSRHIRWRMTASFLATATVAFLWHMENRRPLVGSRLDRVSCIGERPVGCFSRL